MTQDKSVAKTTKREEQAIKLLCNRLSRIEGQIRGIKNMLQNDAYCIDVLMQSSAAISALNSFNKEVLQNHVKGCVTNGIKNGDDSVTDELITILQRMVK